MGDPSLTYYDPVNSNFLYVPPEVKGPISVTVNPAGGMPIQRPALKTKEPNVYKIDYPVRPGETRFRPELHRAHHQSDDLHRASCTPNARRQSRDPNGVTVKSDDLELAGTEPKSWLVFTASRTPASKWKWTERASSRRRPCEGSGDDNGQPQVQEDEAPHQSMY